MKLSIIAALLATAASVMAQDHPITVIQPVSGSVWNAGQTYDITWSINDPTVTTIESITLRKGASNNLEVAGTITSTPFNASALKYSWAIPKETTTDSSYAVQVSFNGGKSEYSPQFVIQGVAPGVSATSAAATTPAAKTTAAAGSSGAKSSAPAKSSSSSLPANDEGAASGIKINAVLGAAAVGAVGALLF